MRWYKRLYLGPNAACNIEKIRRKAEEGKRQPGVYYLTLASTPGNLLDIFHDIMLAQPLFAEVQRLDIVGVAIGQQEAYRLAERIVFELYQEIGGFDPASYFQEDDFC
ncbi:MAG: hypothetical protein LUD73_03305 [Lachnospiraceae bacterium]|nr:hypothetical protein [Lachnospiraceae bacterium]MCD8248398.1 hypothetical protein [Lachnospiraceae bacterium]